MRKVGLAFAAVVSLVFSLILPTAVHAAPYAAPGTAPRVAPALPTTKTVTVTDHNGAPYAGAQVAFSYEASGTDDFINTPIVVTNAQGVATVNVSGIGLNDYVEGLVVQPPATDTSNATFFGYTGARYGASAFSVHLVASNALVRLVNADGTAAAANTRLGGQFQSSLGADTYTRKTLRSGVFGIDLAPTMDANSVNNLEITGNNWKANFAHTFGVKALADSANFVPVIYSDSNATNPLTPVSGVYTLSFDSPQISGVIQDSNGNALNLAAPVSASIFVLGANPDGSPNYQYMWYQTIGMVKTDGTFKLLIPGLPAGKYFPVVMVSGSLNLPGFMASPFFIDAQGRAAASQQGNYLPVNQFNLAIQLPAVEPNFRVSAVSPNGTPEPGYLSLINSQSLYLGPGNALNGLASWSLPDGTYTLYTAPADTQRTSDSYTISVVGGVVSLTDSAGNPVLRNGAGVFSLVSKNANLKLRYVSPSDGSFQVQGQFDLTATSGPMSSSFGSNLLGESGQYVSDGTYDITTQTWGMNPRWSQQTYHLVVSGSGTSFVMTAPNGSTVQPDAGGFYNLAPAVSNVILNVVDPQNPGISIWSPAIQVSHETSAGVSSSYFSGDAGVVSAFEPDGTYTLTVRPDSSNPKLAEKYFTLVVSGANVSLSDDKGIAIPQVNGEFTVSPALANVLLTVVRPGAAGAVIPSAVVNVQTTVSSSTGYSLNQGLIGLVLADGTYPLVAEPRSSDALLAHSAFTLVVSNFGSTVAVTDESGTPVVANIDGVFALAVKAANLPIQVVSPFVAGQVIQSAQVTYYQVDANGNQSNWNWAPMNQGKAGIALADGHFKVNVQPNSSDTALAGSSFDVVVTNGIPVVKNQSGQTINADSAGLFNLEAGVSNFVLRAEDPAVPGAPLVQSFVSIDQITQNGSIHISDSSTNQGILGVQLADGSYSVTVQPSNANPLKTSKTYSVTVATNGTSVDVRDSLGNQISPVGSGLYPLTVGQANVLGQLADSSGVVLQQVTGSYTGVELQKWSTQYNQFVSIRGTGADANGRFGLTITEPGTYRLKISPNGRTDVSTTYTPSFVVNNPAEVAALNKDLGKINLNAPALLVEVRTATGQSNLSWSPLNVQDGNNWDWQQTGQNGTAALGFTHAGTYQITVQPKGDFTTPNSTAKSYRVTVTTDANGLLVASIDGIAKESDGSYILRLGTPNLSGTLKDPTGTASMPYDQIVPMNAVTGELLWAKSTSTDSSGNWALNLPAGQYKLVSLAPSSLGSYGHGVSAQVVTIDAQGQVSATGGANPNALELRLKTPTWSGIVTEPGTSSVMANVSVCIGFGQVVGTYNNTCTSTNQDGKWAISAPAEFTGFDDSSWVQINENQNPQYAQNRYQGKTAVESALGSYVAGQAQTGIVLKPKAPNTSITVTAGGNPVASSWVQFYDAQGQYLGGSQTNANGVAKVNLANPGADVTLDISIQGNQDLTGKYSGVRKLVAGSSFTVTNGSYYSLTVALPVPNVQAIVREPGVGGVAVSGSYVNINNPDGSWFANANVDNNGYFSANLPTPSSGTANYIIGVHNAWNATSNYVDKSYVATVDGNGNVSLAPQIGGGIVGTETYLGNTVSTLVLARPSVNGKVNLPDGVTPVANSWVTVTDSTSNQWVAGVNSRADGSFAAAPADGSYSIEANIPWGTGGLAKSAPCLVTVSGGVTTTSGTNCVDANGVVGLQLRAPNLTFTLMDGTGAGAKPVPFATVNMNLGNWNTWAQADKNGLVSLFVDVPDIAAKNPSLTGDQNLNVWVDPPFGSSNIVRWGCASGDTSKPLCGNLPKVTIGQAFPTTNIGNVAFLQPNARIRVTYPAANGTAAPVEAGAWVSIFQTNVANCNGCRNWIGGGNTDSNGYVSFNLPDVTSAATYAVEVNAPWQKRALFAQVVTEGVLGSQLDSTLATAPDFALASPNLSITVQQPANNGVSRWSGIGVEKIDATSGNWLAWVGWYGTDDKGVGSMLLPSNGRYRLTVYPGGGAKGTSTMCLVDVDGQGVVSLVAGKCNDGSNLTGSGLQTMTITLSLGNVTGTVFAPDNTTLVAGAIVLATAVDGSHVALAGVATQQYTTGTDGKFGFQLDPQFAWDLKVYYVPAPGSSVTYQSNLTPVGVTPGTNSSAIALGVL